MKHNDIDIVDLYIISTNSTYTETEVYQSWKRVKKVLEEIKDIPLMSIRQAISVLRGKYMEPEIKDLEKIIDLIMILRGNK